MCNKILAVRVGRVGDTVMMTPALTALTTYYPNAEITLITSPVGKSLLSDFHPNIKDIWTWNRSGLIKPYTDKSALISRLKNSSFDLIVCFDTSHRIADLLQQAGCDFHQYKGSKVLKHSARAYLEFLSNALQKPLLETYNYLPVEEESRQQVDIELAKHGITADDKLLMIHPTFSGYSRFGTRKRHAKLRKLWDPKNYANLAKTIVEDPALDVKIIMVLLEDELSFGKKILDYSDNNILLLKSESTFERYKAMINRADVLLSPDSGPMHIASSLNTRIVAFFSMKDPGNCGPYMPSSQFIILRSEDTDTPEKGINAIDVNTVYTACKKLLGKD